MASGPRTKTRRPGDAVGFFVPEAVFHTGAGCARRTSPARSSMRAVGGRETRFPVRGGARTIRRLSLRITGGGRPPDWSASGAGLHRGTRVPRGRVTSSRIARPGAAPLPLAGGECGETPFRAKQDSVVTGAGGPLGPWPPSSLPLGSHYV